MTAPDHTLDAALVRLEALLGAATPAPWHRFHDESELKQGQHPCHCGQIWSDNDLLFTPARDIDDKPVERIEDGRLIVALRNAADAFVALAKAAQERAHDGHSEMCQMMFPRVWRECGCGHDDLVAAMEGVRKVLPC